MWRSVDIKKNNWGGGGKLLSNIPYADIILEYTNCELLKFRTLFSLTAIYHKQRKVGVMWLNCPSVIFVSLDETRRPSEPLKNLFVQLEAISRTLHRG